MKPLEIKGDKLTVHGELFDSIFEFVRLANSRPKNKHGESYNSSHQDNRDGWAGTKTYEEAERLLQNGWEDPLEHIKQGARHACAVKQVESRTRAQYRNYIVGQAPNVPRALMGLPDAMRQIYRQPMKSKTIALYYDISVNCGTDTARMTKGGIAVLAVVTTLERLGFRVALWCCEGFDWYYEYHYLWAIPLKHYRDALDLKKLCFPFAHPAMLRRISFQWAETTPLISVASSGYGTPFNNSGSNPGRLVVQEHFAKQNGFYFSLRDCENAKHDPDVLMDNLGISRVVQDSVHIAA